MQRDAAKRGLELQLVSGAGASASFPFPNGEGSPGSPSGPAGIQSTVAALRLCPQPPAICPDSIGCPHLGQEKGCSSLMGRQRDVWKFHD